MCTIDHCNYCKDIITYVLDYKYKYKYKYYLSNIDIILLNLGKHYQYNNIHYNYKLAKKILFNVN